MMYGCLFLLFFIVFLLCFHTDNMISSIRFKRKYNIRISISDVEIIAHIIIYTLGLINISISIWALLNNQNT